MKINIISYYCSFKNRCYNSFASVFKFNLILILLLINISLLGFSKSGIFLSQNIVQPSSSQPTGSQIVSSQPENNTFTANADVINKQKIDSINRVLLMLKGQERLDAISNLCAIAFVGEDPNFEINCLNRYIFEARKQGNVKEEAYARNSKLVCYYNYDMVSDLIEYLPENLKFFAEHQLWDKYYGGWSMLVDLYIYQNKNQTALREAKMIYKDAREKANRFGLGIASYTMGCVYQNMQNIDESSKAYKQAIEYLSDSHDNTVLMYTYENYSEVLIAKSDYHELKQITQEWIKIINRLKETYLSKGYDITDLDSKYRYYYLAMARVQMETFNFDESLKMLHEAELLTPDYQSVARLVLLKDYARYYQLKKEYKKALEYNDIRISLNSTGENLRGLLDAKEQRADILMSAGKYSQAAPIYKEIIPIRDSLVNISSAEQLNELNTLYKVDELKFEKKLTTNRLYFSLACITLLLAILIIYILYTQRLRKKNRKLYDSIIERHKAQDILRISSQTSKQELSEDEMLFRQLCSIMAEQQIFTNSEIKREELAAMLNTNRTYLAEAVKKYADGATIIEFINSYRLRYAASLLSKNHKLSISEVEYLSGFNSRSTFSRLFSDTYGMSPSRYRAISKERAVN